MDYYKVLGLSRTAPQEEIQKAYHDLALKYHPDVNQGNDEAAEKFKAINKAYQVLRNPDKRKEYDATLGGGRPNTAKTAPATGAPRSNATPSRGVSVPSSPSVPSVPSTGNPMADILGGMRNAARANMNAQSESAEEQNSGVPMVEIRLTPREAVNGAIKTIKVNGRLLRIKISIGP